MTIARAMTNSDISKSEKAEALSVYSKLAPTFIPNAGLFDDKVLYYNNMKNCSWYFTTETAVFAFVEGSLPSAETERMMRRRLDELPRAEREPMQGMSLAVRFIGASTNVCTWRWVFTEINTNTTYSIGSILIIYMLYAGLCPRRCMLSA